MNSNPIRKAISLTGVYEFQMGRKQAARIAEVR